MANVRHRVVVQLKEVSMEDDRSARNSYETGASPESLMGQTTDAEVVDNRTLALTQTTGTDDKARTRCLRQMHFDCVGGTADIQTRAEFGAMLDLLIMQHYNCCLVQFSGSRSCQVNFLCNLLATEVDRRLQKLHAFMHSVRLEFYDVLKFDVINLFASAGKNKRVLRPRARNHFNNTLELLKWLQSDYAQMWALGRGHNILELHFKYSDGRRRLHTTKFSVVDIHIGQLDTESRISLRNFLGNCTGEKRLRQTNTLIDCLREYFAGPELWRTWLLFDVPSSSCRNAITEDLLKLATAAYAGSQTSTATEGNTEFQLGFDSDISAKNALVDSRPMSGATQDTAATHRCQLPSKAKKRSKLHQTVGTSTAPSADSPNQALPTDSHVQIKKRVEDFSNRDLDSLSNWYCKMDERYALVIAAMEAYYDRKYDSKITKIGSDIQQLVRTDDQPVGDVLGKDALLPQDAKQLIGPEQLLKMHELYRQAVAAFRVLAHEAESSKYGALLQIYLKTKNFELTQHALRFKMRQLENCRTHLSEIIKREIGALNSLRQQAAALPRLKRHATKLVDA